MCGIVGVLAVESMHEGLHIVERMNHAILHRGPDEVGEWETGEFAFGMRRLSIIDLTGGHQPMWTEESRVSVGCRRTNPQQFKSP
jgi:asparagine synthase (glutamine-hydrolysing)